MTNTAQLSWFVVKSDGHPTIPAGVSSTTSVDNKNNWAGWYALFEVFQAIFCCELITAILGWIW